MIFSRKRLSLAIFCVVTSASTLADSRPAGLSGHTKLRLVSQMFPDDSIYRDLTGSNATDIEGDLRLSFSTSAGRWNVDAAYQLVTLTGDTVEYTRSLPTDGLFGPRLSNDDRRLLNLTDVIHDDGNSAVVQRLDRLSAGYTSEKTVFRFGRQALSWGNGLFYAPMDLVNPFDPAAIDTEFKSGDDMLYVQYLRDSGDDVQSSWVFRRNPASGDVDADEATVALKYHGFAGQSEFDLLVASSYGKTVVGIGGVRSAGGAIWTGDFVVTDTRDSAFVQFVTNLSYSWMWHDRNMSGVVEYYFSGFGQRDGDYDLASLAKNPDLILRLARGESYALGRNYLAGSVTIEMSPLWVVTPTLLANADDGSGLLQLVTRYSLGNNMTLLGSLNVPLGAAGSEFGGIGTGVDNRYLSTGAGLFAQFAYYF